MSILKRDELSIIFKYLNGVDLHNASQVCSFWLEIAIEENNRRKPTWIMKSKSVECLQDWKTFKTQFIDHCRTRPSLHLLFYTCSTKEELLPEGCYCQYLPYHCSSITIKYFRSWRFSRQIISTFFFPEISNINITTITLNYHPENKGVYCEELKCLFDISFSNADKLKTIFEPFTGNDIPMSSCVVFIYNFRNKELVQNLALCFKEWFPNKKMTILSIKEDSILFCNANYNSRVCQKHADCIAILLNGTNMESFIFESELNSSIEKEMTEFKKRANLKEHSVFFKISSLDGQYVYRDKWLFQTIFPNVPLFMTPCTESVATNKIEEFCNSILEYDNLNKYPGFLLLTYD